MASPANFLYGPGQTPDNVTALPAGQAKSLGAIGSAGAQIYDIMVAPMSFTTTGTASGTIDIYVTCSEDGGAAGHWTDGINPTLTTDQSGSLSQARLVASIDVQSAGVYRSDEWSVATVMGNSSLPMFICLFVFNKTGQPLGATAGGHYLQYSLLNYAVPAPLVYG